MKLRNTSPEMLTPEELSCLLGYQNCLKVPQSAYIIFMNCHQNPFKVICNLFNLGYIMGQRAERAKRKEHENHD